MTQPIICNSDAERPIFPVDCPDGWWAVPVTDLSEIKKPDRDHAYLLPDNSVWILNYDGTAMVQLNDGDTSSGQPTQITNKDGYITITGSGTHSVTADLSEDLVESIDTAVKDIQLSAGQLTFTKNDESQIDIKLGEGLSVKDNEIFVDVEDKNEPTKLKNTDGYLEISGSGTHNVTIDVDYDELMSDFYTKEESDNNMFEAITGNTVTIDTAFDFKNKVLGSVVENPNIAAWTQDTSLVLPTASLQQFTQSGYDKIKSLDDVTAAASSKIAGAFTQVILSFNVIESIERKYPKFFEGLNTISEKTAKISTISKITYNVYGYASGANSTTLSTAFCPIGSNPWGTVIKTDSTKPVRNGRTLASGITKNIFDDNGFVHIIAFAPVSDGTTPSALNIDYANFELSLTTSATDIYSLKSEVYTKEETDEQIFEAVSGDMQTVTNVMDLNGKITGSVVENPNTAKMLGWDSLRPPTSTAAYEMNQDRYNGMKTLADGKMYNVTHITSGNLLQVILGWNIIEDIERRHPELFTNLGATTIAEKIEVSNKLLQEVTYNVYGYGSAPNSTALTTAPYSNGANDWGGTAVTYGETVRKNGRTIPKVDIHYIIQDDGFVYVIAYAAATDGVTPSKVVIDYASLEYSLAISAADIYALKKDVYTKQEVEERLLDTLSGEPIFMTEAIDFMYKGTGSTAANSNIAKWGGGLTIQQPSTTTFTELNQARYDTIKNLDEKTADVQTTTNNSMIQMLFRWNLVEDIERKHPKLFGNFGATSISEKVAVAKKVIIHLAPSVDGFGSSSEGNKLSAAVFFNQAWAGTNTNLTDQIKRISWNYSTEYAISNLITEDGYIYVIAYAPPSDGTTPSAVSIDYASLEYTLNVATTDIYALKKNTYTKSESDTKFLEYAQLIPDNSDLNDYKTEGTYYCNSNISAGTILNNPSNQYSFSLRVEKTNSVGFVQTVEPYLLTTNIVYHRKFYNGSWSSWYRDPINVNLTGDVTGGKTISISDNGVFTIPTTVPKLANAQLNKITRDDGERLLAITSGSILETVIANTGFKTGVSTNGASDHPSGTYGFRFTSYINSGESGWVRGMSDDGKEWFRNISAKNWIGGWKRTADIETAQMFKITADNGTNRFAVPSGNSLMDRINTEGYGYYLIGVSASASDVPQIAQGYQAVVQSNSTSNPTGTVLLKANNGRMFMRGFTSGAFVGNWIETADSNKAQMSKITDDNGGPVATVTSGSILSKVLSRAPGMTTYTFTNVTTDYPKSANTSMRGFAFMTSASYGYVMTVDILGNTFVRAIVNSTWVGEWRQVASSDDIESKQNKLIAGENITIDNNVISTTLSNKIDAQALLNGVNIGGKYRNESIQNIFFLYQSKDFKLSELIDFEKAVVYRGMKGQDVFQLTAVSELDEQNISEQETDQEVKSFVCNLTVSLNREYLYYVNLVINYEGEQYSMMKEITQYG